MGLVSVILSKTTLYPCTLLSLYAKFRLLITYLHDSCASSKHLQTRRFLDTICQYLSDVQKLVMHIHRQANERSDAFVDHSGVLIDSKTGVPLVSSIIMEEDEDEEGTVADDLDMYTDGYSFFDSGEVEKLTTKRHRKRGSVGELLSEFVLVSGDSIADTVDSDRSNPSSRGVLVESKLLAQTPDFFFLPSPRFLIPTSLIDFLIFNLLLLVPVIFSRSRICLIML